MVVRDARPDELLAAIGSKLATEVEAALPRWVEGSVERIYRSWNGEMSDDVYKLAREAAATAVAEVCPQLRQLLCSDVDDQWTSPMHLLRRAARFPTDVLAGCGVPEVVRDSFDERTSPDDVYGLEPTGFRDIDESLHPIGLSWGAAKALAHRNRHGSERS